MKEESYGVGGNVVPTLAQDCDIPAGSRLLFDNWFTPLFLLDRLKAGGIGETGTIRADRFKKAPLQSKKELKKKGKGVFSYTSDKKKMVVRWLFPLLYFGCFRCFLLLAHRINKVGTKMAKTTEEDNRRYHA